MAQGKPTDLDAARVHRAWLVVLIEEQVVHVEHLKALGVNAASAADFLEVLHSNLDLVDDFIGRRTPPTSVN